ncbi:uncharacterized protein FFB20_05760 [Fusarium fujikuroi]|uniref:CBM-cenC domain-containing protein n=2 Tax=Fusarium fujikuroi TaxID=5127 RepID=S0EAN9_GIBF5|nr:uncharacterized protein FFUJ_14030 [Fusarium fujikuroi IMI 58289]KLO92490.1 uncharacterized protein LW93_12064 [Fusarium fujikuroi]KLP18025.1 uncharacterized protein LW94_13580 [Fusarium fujikuroi]QGI67628.1 hypothetical protein CEK27_011599 [Fusarium fujikuroi]QGI84857.1 hypothetical protein CEK25_011586 [Fusarium fujikuroi]QGI98512.1 hypothetical protein CEK26_011581 [Fusarium fujikuroi]
MRVTTTFGSLILGAGLCAARACAPHPRPTTTSSFSSEIGTTTAGGAATTTTSQEALSITDSTSSIESSVTVETSTADSATTEHETTTSSLTSQEASSVTESQTSVESSATTTDGISSFTTMLTTTTAVTSQETETSTTVDEATSTTAEATTTTAGPPVITNLAVNGGFEDETIDPWVVEGASPAVYRSQFWCAEGSKCLQLPGNFANSAKVCQSVAVEAGFEYTFKAQVLQNCIKEYGSNILVCDDNINTTELSIDGVYDSGNHGIVGYNTYNDFSYTFSYTGPSIDSTDLCITITQNQGLGPVFYLDGVSFTRGQAVPIPDPTE